MINKYRVRASSWGELFDCAYRWEGKQILGLSHATGGPAALGSALHASTAAFDQARIDGADVSADDAAEVFMQTLKDPGYDVVWDPEEMSRKDAEKSGLGLHVKYCLEFSPKYTFKAVELETKPLDIDCGNGVIITLTGRMDRARLRDVDGKLGISDLKSGGAAVQKGVAKIKGHRPQIGVYELLTEHTLGIPIEAPGEIIGLKTKGTLEIGTADIHGAKTLLVGQEEPRIVGLIEHAAVMFSTGLFPPNPNSNLCGPRYCPRWSVCKYHD